VNQLAVGGLVSHNVTGRDDNALGDWRIKWIEEQSGRMGLAGGD
jgi:hypothetical protein